jgi:hypothetical protein
VFDRIGQVAHSATFEEFLQGYLALERDDTQRALEYAAWLTRDEVRSRRRGVCDSFAVHGRRRIQASRASGL